MQEKEKVLRQEELDKWNYVDKIIREWFIRQVGACELKNRCFARPKVFLTRNTRKERNKRKDYFIILNFS